MELHSSPSDRLNVTGMQFYGLHGTEPWEKEVGRRFEVDVALELDLASPGRSDHLSDAVDYRQVYAAVKKVVDGESHQLIERVAWRILEELFAAFKTVSAAHVKVTKPDGAIGGLNRGVSVELTRNRINFQET